MKESEMKNIMSTALDKYGEFALALENKEKILNKAVADSMTVSNIGIQRIREAVIKNGEILDIDEKNNVVISMMNTGLMNAARAFVILKVSDNCLDFIAYAKEGLIKQNLAKKAIDLIKSAL